jgi:hypothetical protein
MAEPHGREQTADQQGVRGLGPRTFPAERRTQCRIPPLRDPGTTRPTPIRVDVGAAALRFGLQPRFVLSAIAAAAAVYGAVVLFAFGSTSPVALDEVRFRPQPVVIVHMRVHDDAVPRPAQRLPQVSPGRARR